jgi:hypothetical protein
MNSMADRGNVFSLPAGEFIRRVTALPVRIFPAFQRFLQQILEQPEKL